MSDFSKVLGQVYAHADEWSSASAEAQPPAISAPAPQSGPSTPEWADDAHLDQAFANWSPGPPPEAPAAERRFAANLPAPREPSADQRLVADAPAAGLDDDLAAALSAALASAAPDGGQPVFTAATPDATAVGYAPSSYVPSTFAPVPEATPVPAGPMVAGPVAAAPLPATPLPTTPLPATPLPTTPLPATPLPATGEHAFAWIDGPAPGPSGLEVAATVVVPAAPGAWNELGLDVAAPAAEPEVQRPWQRSDDDILPHRSGRAHKGKAKEKGAETHGVPGVAASHPAGTAAGPAQATQPAKKRFSLSRKR